MQSSNELPVSILPQIAGDLKALPSWGRAGGQFK
jgi:hypothetical protein